MLNVEEFYKLLRKNGINFFTGVPDSLLKDFCAYIDDTSNDREHIIAANEGNAIALATGNYLATGNIGLVYMQNSGFGNSINPLLSLNDAEVYSIPVLLLIGWRGEPGVKDEPQHTKQGKIMLSMLENLQIAYKILPDSLDEARIVLDEAFSYMKSKNVPYALVVRKDIFEKYEQKNKINNSYELNREDAIKLIVNQLGAQDVVVSTTGKISREIFEYRERLGQDHSRDFLTVGSMGHASQIALGIALQKYNRQIYCIDGDGALIMHMGGTAVIGRLKPKNFKHIVINNGAHDSVGGQPTAGFDIDILAVAKACGYRKLFRAETNKDIKNTMVLLKSVDGPALLEIRVNKGSRKDLGRPTTTPIENKNNFMKFLKE